MANITEQNEWSGSIFLLETTTPALGGEPTFSSSGRPSGGFANTQAKQLADRTQYLKAALDDVEGLDDRVTTVETNLDSHIGSRGASHGNATQTVAGFMSAADKVALAGKLDASANAVSASKLVTPRNINGIPFDGTSDITISSTGGSTNLGVTTSSTTLTVTSSTGTSAVIPVATTTLSGVLSAADKTKLNGVATGAQVNQNAFSVITVTGQADVVADTVQDTLTLAAGSGISITTNATSDAITITNTSSSSFSLADLQAIALSF